MHVDVINRRYFPQEKEIMKEGDERYEKLHTDFFYDTTLL